MGAQDGSTGALPFTATYGGDGDPFGGITGYLGTRGPILVLAAGVAAFATLSATDTDGIRNRHLNRVGRWRGAPGWGPVPTASLQTTRASFPARGFLVTTPVGFW
jgi:hypothetical protein